MLDITFYQFFVALLVSIAAWCIFLWAIRTGQFRDVEDIKYQVWPSQGEEKGSADETPEAISESRVPADDR
jgi:cbb3-type cytochrome oxidase maturation protein